MRIVGIDEWGGTRNNNPTIGLPVAQLWVHHSVTTPSGDAYADFRVLDGIGTSQGHGGISYSWVIHPDGTIGEGQGTARGTHTGGTGCNGSPWGQNACTFGICFVGNYMDLDPTPESIVAFRYLRDQLIAAGWATPDVAIGGHRDAPGNSTACPGTNLEAALDQLRQPSGPTPTLGDDVKFYAMRKPGDDKVWLVWGAYKTHIASMDVLNGLLFLGTIEGGAVVDAVPAFLDGLVELTGTLPASVPGVIAPTIDYDRLARDVADELHRRLAS